MRVLHVVQLYYPVASGAAVYFAEVGRRLVGEGHQVTVLTTDAYDLEHFWMSGRRRVERPREIHCGVEIIRLPVCRVPGPALLYPLVRRLMVEFSRFPGTVPLLRRLALLTPRLPELSTYLAQHMGQRYDLVHTTNITLDFAIVPVHAWAHRCNVPVLCTPFVHLGVPGDRSIVRYYTLRHQIDLLKRCDRVITQTSLEQEHLRALGVSSQRMCRIGVGITPAEVAGGDGARFRAAHNIAGPLVLSIGAMAYDKGTVHVVEAMQRLWSAGSTARLVLIGAPLAHFLQFVEQLPASARERILMLPYADDQVKRDALAAADVFAMPSRTDSFGIVYLEAWCYRLPVIGAWAGGVPDVVSHEQDGLLVPFGDVAELAGTIARLLGDRTEARRLGEAGHAKLLRELTWDHKYAQVREVYRELTERSAGL